MTAPSRTTQFHLQNEFLARLTTRLEAGRAEYGDRSFERSGPELIREIEEELLDVAGWAFVLWARLRAGAGRALEAQDPPGCAAGNPADPGAE